MENLKKEIQRVINLYKSQKFSQAELLCRKLIEINPKVSFLYNLLGLILVGQDKYDEAIIYYKKGIVIQPDYAMIYNNLGNVLKAKKNFFDAEYYYKKSIKLDNKLSETQNNLGNLYVQLNRHEEAIICFKKSIELNPNFYTAHYNLGIFYKSIGNFKESKKSISESIRLLPKLYHAHRAYSQIHKYTIDDEHISVMEKLYKAESINAQGKVQLAYALGKAFDDIKKFKNAYKYYSVGNKLRRTNIEFSLKKEKDDFLFIKKIFNRRFLNKYQKIGNESFTPIFILGMPRSGTTLIEQIISSHPKVHAGDELNFFNDLMKDFFIKKDNLPTDFINRDYVSNLKEIGYEYINKINKIPKESNSERVTDKLPINFKWIGFIKLILPKSKIIHCVRNSKDTCLSIFKNFFTNTELNYAYNFVELVNFYNLYGDLMNFWRKNIPGFIIDVKYENLVKNPKKEIPKLVKNCNLSWNKKCIDFYNNKRIIKTASDVQARNQIYTSSINSWKNYEKYLKKYLTKLKY